MSVPPAKVIKSRVIKPGIFEKRELVHSHITSFPIFSTMAGKLKTTNKYSILFEYIFLIVVVKPTCVTIPMRAHISCTAAMSRNVIIAVHSVV